MNAIQRYGTLCLKGIAMGAADVVPGVSGGTIAFIAGIYEELIASLRSITPAAFIILFKQGPTAFWKAINGNFLLSLVSGILFSLLTLARIITHLLENYPIFIWSFFFGLIIASIVFMLRQITHWRAEEIIALVVGCIIAYGISIIPPSDAPKELWFVFISGAIAICAMILPGISGSFVLLLMGMYSFILTALIEFKMAVILTFVSGCLIGLLSFSHLLDWLLKRYHSITISALTGFIIGSLSVVWPWKYATESFIDRHGKEVALAYQRLLPNEYERLTQTDSHLLPAILFMIAGFVLVLLLEKWADLIEAPLQETNE